MEFLEYLRQRIASVEEQQVQFLKNGGAQDYADYRYRVGFIRGLNEVTAKIIPELLEGDTN